MADKSIYPLDAMSVTAERAPHRILSWIPAHRCSARRYGGALAVQFGPTADPNGPRQFQPRASIAGRNRPAVGASFVPGEPGRRRAMSLIVSDGRSAPRAPIPQGI